MTTTIHFRLPSSSLALCGRNSTYTGPTPDGEHLFTEFKAEQVNCAACKANTGTLKYAVLMKAKEVAQRQRELVILADALYTLDK